MKQIALLVFAFRALILAYAQDDDEIRTPTSLIVNGVNTTTNRYPYYVSLRYKYRRTRNATASFRPYCGGSLISDRLVLTAAHCVLADDFLPFLGSARPSTFRQLGLNFTVFPNTYLMNSTTLQLSAFVGAESRSTDLGDGNPVSLWFVHPWFDPTNMLYDIAVGLLSQPATQTPVKLMNAPADIYETLPATLNITAIGLGDVVAESLNEIQMGLNETAPDRNNETTRQLEEANIGTLVSRMLCGKAITSSQQRNSSDGSGNNAYGSKATAVSYGQMCVGFASNDEIDLRMRQQAYAIAALAEGELPYSVQEDLIYRGVDYTNPDDILKLLDGYNDTCQGDSGGPVIIKGQNSTDDVQIGIVSFGIGCGSGIAGVYEAVQNYMNTDIFDNFLLDVITSVPTNVSSISNLVTAIPTSQSSAG